MKIQHIFVMLCALLLGACATTRNVSVESTPSAAKVNVVAMVPSEGNSPEMDRAVTNALAANGLTVIAPLPAGTATTDKADLIVSYIDSWYWDLVMYLRYINIYFYDGKSGKLVLSGNWKNSTLHGFPNPDKVVRELTDDMIAKLPNRGATAAR